MNSVFAAATLACVSQAVRLQAESSEQVCDDQDCYSFNKPGITANAAEEMCVAWGGHLAHPKSAPQMEWLRNVATSKGLDRFWIGYNDKGTEDHFTWFGNIQQAAYENWNNNEPNNWGGAEDCTEVRPNGTWNDTGCNAKRNYVCEKQNPEYTERLAREAAEAAAAKKAADEAAAKKAADDKAAEEAAAKKRADELDATKDMGFEASLESRAAHENFKHHQANHMTENENLQAVREQKTEEYFAAQDAAKHASAAANAASDAEHKAHAELAAADAASAKATGEWEHADAVMHAATEAHAAAVKAQADSAAHHATEVATAEAAGHAAQEQHNKAVAAAEAALAHATAVEAAAEQAKSHAEAEKSSAEQAHQDATAALADAHHAAGQASTHLHASKEAALAAHAAYVANVNGGATNGYIH